MTEYMVSSRTFYIMTANAVLKHDSWQIQESLSIRQGSGDLISPNRLRSCKN